MPNRRNFSNHITKKFAEKQSYLCAYCLLPFGTVVSKRGVGHALIQSPVGDHFIPYSFSDRTDSDNLVVACQFCNLLKSGEVFDDIETCRRFVLAKRVSKGIKVLYVPVHNMIEEPEKWQTEFSRFVAAY